jgi:CDP-4-dehydro-6-deoxyglucose reductase
MSQWLNLARAAQLAGVPRGTLQRMIGAGELASADGLIEVAELLRAFPQLKLEDAGLFEKVTRIRDEAFGRRVRERMLPSQEVLAQRLFAQGQELADLRRLVQAYHALVVDARARLDALAGGDSRLADLKDMLDQGLKRALGAAPADRLDAMVNVMQVISAQVTVLPSGRQFLVEGSDSILQAGLKAGLRFAYGCGTGTCGLCKARVVGGATRQIQHADYPLSEAEKAQGYVLLCAHTAVTDVTVETLEARGPADIPVQDIVATVRAVEALAPDTRLLHLQTPRSNRLRFLAGQSVTLGIADGGQDATLTAPLASCPCDERNLHFHVAREDRSPLAQRLFADRLRPGTPVNVRGPTGDFVLDAESSRPLVLIACDTGFAPIKSLLENAMAGELVETFDLYWLATRSDGHYLANQCRAWAAAFDNFTHHLLNGATPEDGAWPVVEAVVASRRELAQCDVFVAGPQDFVQPVVQGLAGAGALAGRTRSLIV